MQPPDQLKSTPDRFRKVWAWQGTNGHTQPTAVLQDAMFLATISTQKI